MAAAHFSFFPRPRHTMFRNGGMAMQGSEAQREHGVTLVDRKRLSLTGVEDVDCFNEQLVVLRTGLGTLTVAGAGLNISRLSLEDGCVEVEGEVDALEYSGGRKKGGFWSRLTR